MKLVLALAKLIANEAWGEGRSPTWDVFQEMEQQLPPSLSPLNLIEYIEITICPSLSIIMLDLVGKTNSGPESLRQQNVSYNTGGFHYPLLCGVRGEWYTCCL